MKKYTITSILFLLSFTIFSCNSVEDNYLEFYTFINDAELNIVDGNFSEAHRIYSEAFEIWSHAPSIDYYNALLCAIKSENYEKAFNYLERLAINGWKLNYFQDNPYLTQLREKKEWKEFVSNYPQLHQTYLESLDVELINELDSMLKRDQSLAKSNNYSEYLKTVILNGNRIQQLIINNRMDNIFFGSENSILYSPFPIVLLRHYCGVYNEAKKGYINISNILNDTISMVNLEESMLIELRKGHLSPLAYDLAINYSSDPDMHGNNLFMAVDSVILRKILTAKEEKEINEKRANIGQEPINDYIKKIEFYNKVGNNNLKKYFYKFRISSSYPVITGTPEKLKRFIDNRLDEGWIKVTP
ncbi:MAG: hypothetical protein R6U66_14715 [Bacteroidales bacterium]